MTDETAAQTGGQGNPDPKPASPDGSVSQATQAPTAPQNAAETARTIGNILKESAQTGEPFMEGTFALYADPSGAVVIVTENPERGVERHTIPPQFVRLVLSLGRQRSFPLRNILRGRAE